MTKCFENETKEINYHQDELEPEGKDVFSDFSEKLKIIEKANEAFNKKVNSPRKDDIAEQLNLSYSIVDTDELQETKVEQECPVQLPIDSSMLKLELSEDEDDQFDEIIHRNTNPRTKDFPRSPAWSEDDEAPLGRRLGPVGQDREEAEEELRLREGVEVLRSREEDDTTEENAEEMRERMRIMEEEQDELSGSLQALTSHYARLQMQLQQVMAAPSENREELLQDLQKFANMGIPDFRDKETPAAAAAVEEVTQPGVSGAQGAVEEQRKLQEAAITNLRGKLEELESYAYQAGEAGVPSSVVLERQRMVIDQLKTRLNIDVSDISRLSEDELRAEVDTKLGEIVNPLRMKSQLVSQLQTQISDLEMFIHFLQEETVSLPEDPMCGCDTHGGDTGTEERGRKDRKRRGERHKKLEEQKENLNIMKKVVAVLQMTGSVTTLGCGGGGQDKFRSNLLKNTTGKHYGDMRAKLELSVEHVLDICCATDSHTKEDAPLSGQDIPTDTEFLVRSPEVTSVIRKQLAPAIRDLMHHGLGQSGGGGGLLPFSGCMSGRQATRSGILHAWDVVVRFYELKGGAEFNSAPARRLSRSFGLDLAPTLSNNKQVLLQTIGQIQASHSLYKRSPDQHFKAFISAGLNKRKLVPWLRLILRNQTILETMYQPSSYVVKTGFDDGFRLLERLSLYVFDLPVNLAVKQFQDMEEAF